MKLMEMLTLFKEKMMGRMTSLLPRRHMATTTMQIKNDRLIGYGLNTFVDWYGNDLSRLPECWS